MPINEVRDTVLAIANKNNYGYISPQDFNLYCEQAQLDIFENYFYQYNSWILKENARQSGIGYANIVKGLEEVIDSFSAEVFLDQSVANLNNANLYSLPNDYYLVNKIFYYPTATFAGTTTAQQGYKLIDSTGGFVASPANPTFLQNPPIGSIIVNTSSAPISQAYVTAVDSATTISTSADIMANGQNYIVYSGVNITEVERVNQNKIFELISSNLTAPTTQFPAYVLGGASSNTNPGAGSLGNTITVYPSTIRQKGAVKVQYIRYPLTPRWTFVNLVGGEPLFNDSAADYQDFELPLSDEPALIAKICQYIGVEIREGDVYQFGATQEKNDNAIQG
tara:strand:- start:1243 stop:2253 length:1011 start_codon:yes stop_codon:yes gene_type:complete